MGAQADQVRKDIISRIQKRELLPGDSIDEAELRKRLHMSGTPIREAVIALEAVGIVERRPRSGARVRSMNLAEFIRLLEAHAEAEGALAHKAARRANPVQIRKLEKMTVACENRAKEPTDRNGDYYDLNLEFHAALFDAAGNEFLADAAYRTGNILLGYLSARHSLKGEIARSASSHREIVNAIKAGDPELARDLMMSHVMMDDAQVLDVMNQIKSE